MLIPFHPRSLQLKVSYCCISSFFIGILILDITEQMEGITYINHFVKESADLYQSLKTKVDWDERMKARKTASFGKAYNYSQICYPFQVFIDDLEPIVHLIHNTLNFKPNNCLINYYPDGNSKMGFHSDETTILEEGTGVAIISIGEVRTLRFRNILDRTIIKDYVLTSGSLIYMNNDVQEKWQHAIPKTDTENGRMSLTFRRLL